MTTVDNTQSTKELHDYISTDDESIIPKEAFTIDLRPFWQRNNLSTTKSETKSNVRKTRKKRSTVKKKETGETVKPDLKNVVKKDAPAPKDIRKRYPEFFDKKNPINAMVKLTHRVKGKNSVAKHVVYYGTQYDVAAYCHFCGGAGAMMVCGNYLQAKDKCKKVVCKKCFEKHNMDWMKYLKSADWVCTHCRKCCPDCASCERSRRIREEKHGKKGKKRKRQKKVSDDEIEKDEISENSSEETDGELKLKEDILI